LLNANQINSILNVFFDEIESRLPEWNGMSVGEISSVSSGVHGPFMMSALISGEHEGKITLLLEWDTATKLAGDLLQKPIESFDEESKEIVESLFHETMNGIASTLNTASQNVEYNILPTLSNSTVLLAEDRSIPVVKIPIQTRTGVMQLFLGFK
jgi:chemotaxis protein CheY-P-specific phosphatase CheC